VVPELSRYVGSLFGWSRSFENSSRVSLGGKFSISIYLDLFSIGFPHSLLGFLENMANSSQSTVKTVNVPIEDRCVEV